MNELGLQLLRLAKVNFQNLEISHPIITKHPVFRQAKAQFDEGFSKLLEVSDESGPSGRGDFGYAESDGIGREL